MALPRQRRQSATAAMSILFPHENNEDDKPNNDDFPGEAFSEGEVDEIISEE